MKQNPNHPEHFAHPLFPESGSSITFRSGGFFNRHYGDFCTGADSTCERLSQGDLPRPC